MQVSALGTTYAQATDTSSSSDVTRTVSNELGQDAFLKLLLTQLEYQDPLNPMEDTEFIAQLAQFTSLSELQKLNASMTDLLSAQGLASASSLIGLSVTGMDGDGNAVTGLAEAALMRDGSIYVRVGDTELPLGSVTEVGAGA